MTLKLSILYLTNCIIYLIQKCLILNWLKGELREYDNPENRQFLAAIMKGTVLTNLVCIFFIDNFCLLSITNNVPYDCVSQFTSNYVLSYSYLLDFIPMRYNLSNCRTIILIVNSKRGTICIWKYTNFNSWRSRIAPDTDLAGYPVSG